MKRSEGTRLSRPAKTPRAGLRIIGSLIPLFLALVLLGADGKNDANAKDRAAPTQIPNSAASAERTKPPAKDKVPAQKPDKPLLLLDEEEDDKPASGPVADNSRCLVCHINFAREELSVVHAKANVGCAKCHGVSDAHIADESWASGGIGTAPDKMFPTNKINAFCLECHPRKKIDSPPHDDILAGVGEKKSCVDCHGKHRMAKRKCKWK